MDGLHPLNLVLPFPQTQAVYTFSLFHFMRVNLLKFRPVGGHLEACVKSLDSEKPTQQLAYRALRSARKKTPVLQASYITSTREVKFTH